MRFSKKPSMKLGDQRIVKKFLWIPRSLTSTKYRWLEFAKIREEVQKKSCGGFLAYEWEEIEFID